MIRLILLWPPGTWSHFLTNMLHSARYSCYRLVCQITLQYYRNRDELKEFDARRRLTAAIANMAAVESA